MGIFEDNITSKTRLQEFYDKIKEVIQYNFERFYQIYRRQHYSLDLSLNYTASILNHEISEFQKDFAEFGMHHPWLSCTPIASIKPFESKVLVTILYSEDPIIYAHEDAKIFLKLKLNIPSLL